MYFFVSYGVRDAKNANSSMQVKFPSNNDLDTIMEFALSTAQLIDPLIRGQITSVGVGVALDLPGALKDAPLATSDVEEGAEFSFLTTGGAKHNTGFRIPTFDETFLVSGTREVDTANATVDALVDRITEGFTAGLVNVSPSNLYGEDIVSLDSARESFTSSRG